jgi:hypothetical protein
METAIRRVIQKGWMISAGETQGDYSLQFPLRADEIDRAKQSNGNILFWGRWSTATYSRRFNGWCRAYNAGDDSWHFAGAETLNYFT